MEPADPAPPRLDGPRVALLPLAPEHAPGLRAIRRQPGVERWWRAPEDDFPLHDEPDAVRYTVLLKDDAGEPEPTPRGMIQYYQETEPDYRHAGIDVFLDQAVHGRGIGREVIAVLARHLVDDLGHHRLTIDPAADNAAAIACYTAVGFRPVGVMRRYERGPDGTFHDGLLMDALAEDLAPLAP
jgi:aminoglycoside 6'-N-acetyltransferase